MAVAHVDGKPLDVELQPSLEPWLARDISIAIDSQHWRDGRQLINDRSAADVTGMKDELDPLESCEQLRTNETVCVRYESDDHAANLYPIPWTVRMNWGWRGLGSIFWRSHATWTSTVRVEGMEL